MTKIDYGGITIITFADAIAEIVISQAAKPISADELVRTVLPAAKITNSGAVKTANSGETKTGNGRPGN